MIIKTKKLIEVSDWDKLIKETYGRIYSFQQQDGCKERGVVSINIPEDWNEDFENDEIPELVNGDEMGVSFKAWLERDPKKPLPNRDDNFGNDLFWKRNFYPEVQTIANDLYKKGLIEKGEYAINIDW